MNEWLSEWMYTNDSEWQAGRKASEHEKLVNRNEKFCKNWHIDNIQYLHVITKHISVRIYALAIA